MFSNESRNNGAMNVAHMQDSALNGLEFVCGVLGYSVHVLLRPQAGTQDTPVPIKALSAVLMTLLPLIASMFMNVGHLIPFINIPAPRGMVGFAEFTKIFFAASAFQAFRHWRLMVHPEKEDCSTYEGLPLPFFPLIPWLGSYWKILILGEPLFVFLAAIVLQDFFIIQASLAVYLKVAAFALSGSSFVSWFKYWQQDRARRDIAFVGRIRAKTANNEATEQERSQIFRVTLPANLDLE